MLSVFLVPMGRVMPSKFLIQFSFEGLGRVPSLLFDLRPNSTSGGGDKDNGDLPQKIPCMYCYTQCPQSCSRPPLTHASPGDSWTPTGKSGAVSCGVTAPFFWVLVHKVLFCPPRVYFAGLCKYWELYGGVMATSSKRAYAIPKSAAPRASGPAADHTSNQKKAF